LQLFYVTQNLKLDRDNAFEEILRQRTLTHFIWLINQHVNEVKLIAISITNIKTMRHNCNTNLFHTPERDKWSFADWKMHGLLQQWRSLNYEGWQCLAKSVFPESNKGSFDLNL